MYKYHCRTEPISYRGTKTEYAGYQLKNRRNYRKQRYDLLDYFSCTVAILGFVAILVLLASL